MRGALHLCQRILVGLLVLSLLLLPISRNWLWFTSPALAAPGPLELARDTVWSTTPNYPGILHELYFVLPTSAAQIAANDFVILEFPNYNNVQIDNLITLGHFGDPHASLDGTTVTLTNLSLLPGTGLTISNIFATNPDDAVGNQVIIKISEDAAGTQVRNQATIIPNDSGVIIQVSATIISPMSALVINGYSSANAFVTLLENYAVVATTVADGLGNFIFNMTAVTPGAHTYKISATDQQNRSTAQTSLNLFLLANYLTTASGILLSSTLFLDKTEIDPGETITFSGAGKPNSQINIFVESPLQSFLSQSGSEGLWDYTMDSAATTILVPGEYRVYTVVQDQIGNQSIVGNTMSFRVKAPVSNNPPAACDISHGDLNCDGKTSLIDFSILLYHWNSNHKVADINGDLMVNLVDFSIMMFYFS